MNMIGSYDPLLVAGIIMGSGISAMHYVGMAAMRIQAVMHYQPELVLLSILIGIAASIAALWISFSLRSACNNRFMLKAGGSFVMGLAIAGMHYAGMAAVSFIYAPAMPAIDGSGISLSLLAMIIAVGAIIVLGFTLLAVLLDQHLSEQTKLRIEEIGDKNVQLKHANRMKSEFLANMSHELRTPLNAIIGFSDLLKDGMLGDISDEQKEYLGDIHANGQHLLYLVNDILDLSKVEAGHMVLELEAGNVGEMLESTWPWCAGEP